jgi:hypothetical protein
VQFTICHSAQPHEEQILTPETACNGTIVVDSEMGEVIQLQGDQRKDVQEFLTDKSGLELDAKTIKVSTTIVRPISACANISFPGPWFLNPSNPVPTSLRHEELR